jgi:hypothetical protein
MDNVFLLEQELKKLLKNEIKIKETSDKWEITINKVSLKVNKISNNLIKKNIITDK